MRRTSKSEPRANVTARHYLSQPQSNYTCARIPTYFTPHTAKLHQLELANYLARTFSERTVFFVDTCFVTGPHLEARVWTEILRRRVGLTQCVMQELTGWLLAPSRHLHLWRSICAAQLGQRGSVWLDAPDAWSRDQLLGITYYVNLLTERKRAARGLVLRFEEKYGRPPTDSERNRLFQAGWLSRDFHVLRPGELALRKQVNEFTDEELVVTACAFGLIHGVETAILTRDRGVFDQFAKLVAILTTNYLSMLFAELYAVYRDRYETVPMPTGNPHIDAYFVAERSFLVRKPVPPDSFSEWLLPPEFVPTRIHCILLSGDGNCLGFDSCVYEAESDMQRVVSVKGRTRGWNTDRLIDHNCHITGFPRGIAEPRNLVAIVQDREEYAGVLGFPKLELAHACFHFDDPTSKVPPQDPQFAV
jgi:hypothetical protein